MKFGVQGSRFAWYLALCAIAVAFTVSSNLLTYIGSPYISDGGLFVQKIHPVSYLAMFSGLSCLLNKAVRGTLMCVSWLVIAFLTGMASCAIYAVATSGAGYVIVLLDTFVPAGLLAITLSEISGRQKSQLRRLAQCLILLNACIALGEFATQGHLVPVVVPGLERGKDFRPTALYDHPLTGAAVTILGLWLMPFASSIGRWCYVGVLIAALFAFGERTPFAVMTLCMTGHVLSRICRKVFARDLQAGETTQILAVAVAFLCIASAMVWFLGDAGMRLGAHLYWDDSAQVRLNQFGLLGALNWHELLFGCPRDDLLAMIEPMRLSSHVAVIENFWLLNLVALGLLCFPIFVASFAALLRWLWHISGSSGHFMIVLFLVVASASNSLGRKSTLLVTLVACVVASIAQSEVVCTPDLRRAVAR